jgi:glucose/arabinose dehydrogenase/azurin/lysophospholipase L1-like esterase
MDTMIRIRSLLPALVGVLISAGALHGADQDHLVLQPGDHIAVIGNGLADRMQHDGWLESMIYKANPTLDLTVRTLAFSCDEVVTRLVTDTGASRSEWLAKTHSDVVLAFFGFNESFAGAEGVAKFKQELDGFLKDTLKANYNGKGAPRLVLFSPIAAEKMPDPNLADPSATNANLTLYTAAMAEVAKADHVQFVDLFTASQRLYGDARQPLTFNGIHLTEGGDKALAPVIFTALFGGAPPTPSASIDALRAAVVDKNETWHSRYRTVDSYNIFGGRSTLSYESGKGGPKISNAEVMHGEMAQRDVMTANRDQRVWAVAKGGDLKVTDNDLPPVTPVKTNIPGTNPDGSHVFLSGEEAIKHMKVPAGFKVTLFASEEQFPELIKPLQMAWDTKGRLWISAWTNYPERTPDSKDGDKILIIEDTKGTGKADKVTTYLGDLNCPTGFQFYKDGILVMESPDLWWVRDTTGNGHADWKERMLMGLDAADSHHETNSMVLDPGGATYLSDGVFMRSQVETAAGPVRNTDGAIYRYEPLSQKFERYVAYGFANPHGRVFDYWGTDIITDATGNENFFAPAFSGHIDYPLKHEGMKQFWNRPSRPCPGTAILSSRHFPDDYNGNFLNCNVIGLQGIFRVKVSEDGSGLKGETLENLISSDDPNFRPTGISVAPDGSLYFMDWSNAIIGHMQHHLRDPNRDHQHGRIYRMTYEGRPLLTPPKIDGQPVAALMELLKVPENDVRTRAKIELSKHDPKEVIAAVDAWAASLDASDPAVQHHLMEALWVHQWQNVVDVALLKRLLRSSDFHARAAATRVLCYWRDRIPEALTLLKVQAQDEHPRVRLEAVRAASFYEQWEAADVALASLTQPTDYYLTYCLKETMRQLTPWWKSAITDGKPLAKGNPKGVEYILAGVSTADLAKLPKSEPVYLAMFARSDAPTTMRQEALQALATQRSESPLTTLLSMLKPLADSGGPALADACRFLLVQPAADLAGGRDALVKLSGPGAPDTLRQSLIAALMIADGSIDKQWAAAGSSPTALTDALVALTLIPEAKLRATAAARVLPLLGALPAPLVAALADQKGCSGRYVRVELPRKGTLTLAEVQVLSNGTNIATSGTAKQSSTAYGGDASRAIDGKTDGNYGSGSSTHTNEEENQPWWEVDLGTTHPIEAVTVWNRTDGDYYKRLDGFTVTVADAQHRTVTQTAPTPASRDAVTIRLTGDPTGNLRRAAIHAAVLCGADPKQVFAGLAGLLATGEQVGAAAQAIKQLPHDAWQKDLAGAAANGILTWVKAIAVANRTGAEVAEAIGVARDLSGLMPDADARTLRAGLREVGVNVYILNTVREQMRYDQARMVVEAGKPFEVIFRNLDAMPHNLVVVMPGTREKVGQMALTMPPKPDAEGKVYVPKDKAVLASTKLVDPGQQETLLMTAPTEPGEYEYVCTFPGHFVIMWGKLIVAKDVDAYLQTNPK